MKRFPLFLVLLLPVFSACRKELLAPDFSGTVQTCAPIPAEGGSCAVAVEYVSTKSVEYQGFDYNIAVDGDRIANGTVKGPEDLEDGKLVFTVPANELHSQRAVTVAVNPDGHWRRVFEATQLAKERDRKVWEVVEAMKVGWNLGNTLDSHGEWIALYTDGSTEAYETAWGQPVTTPELIRAFADAGFGAIRVPVTWSQHIDPVTYKVDAKWMARVEEVVGYVLDAGLYCILNVHHDTGTEGWMYAAESTYYATSGKFRSLWKQIAERFRDYGDHLLFEGYNELLCGNTWDLPPASSYTYSNKYNQDFVDVVRATGGNNASRYLVVNTYAASSDPPVLEGFVLPDDTVEDHLIAEVHSYAPYPFAFDVAEDPYWGKFDKKVFDDECREAISATLERLDARFVQNGIPCIIGEYGAADKNNERERARQAAWYVSNARKYGITCFYWMSLMDGKDRSTCTWTHPILKDAILNPEKYL